MSHAKITYQDIPLFTEYGTSANLIGHDPIPSVKQETNEMENMNIDENYYKVPNASEETINANLGLDLRFLPNRSLTFPQEQPMPHEQPHEIDPNFFTWYNWLEANFQPYPQPVQLSVETRRRKPYSSSKQHVKQFPIQVIEELCIVCRDKASGYHYNALTCEGCKGFFRRSITRKAIYFCKYAQKCEVSLSLRRKCQFCRLARCIQGGMRADLVVPEDQCRIKREAKQRYVVGSSFLNEGHAHAKAPELTPEAEELIQRMVEIDQEHLLVPDDITPFMDNEAVQLQENPHTFERLIEIVTLNLDLINEFMHIIPGFSILDENDQKVLLPESEAELLIFRMARFYDSHTDSLKLSNGDFTWSYGRETFNKMGVGRLFLKLFDLARSLSAMNLTEPELAMMSALVVFTNRKGLVKPKNVMEIREIYVNALQTYEEVLHPQNAYAFSQIVLKLAEISTLANEP